MDRRQSWQTASSAGLACAFQQFAQGDLEIVCEFPKIGQELWAGHYADVELPGQATSQ